MVNRREAIRALAIAVIPSRGVAARPSVSTIIGTDTPGYHVVRRIELRTGIITTVLGTGQRGDGPEPDPLRCSLSRPHGVLVDASGVLYVGDSEAHRIRVVR